MHKSCKSLKLVHLNNSVLKVHVHVSIFTFLLGLTQLFTNDVPVDLKDFPPPPKSSVSVGTECLGAPHELMV